MALITLTSDIGIQDFMPAAIKGQLLQVNKDAQVIDITHLLPPFNYPQAAYVCRNAIENFPPGTFHIVLVDFFNEKPQHLLIAEHNEQFICCADNGLISMILESLPQKVVALHLDKTAQKNTLYCTRIFAEAIEKLATGMPIEEVGDTTVNIQVKNALRPMLGPAWIEGQIIFIDNFENVVVNIRKDEFEEQRKGRRFVIEFKRDEVIDRISESYADVPDGEKLALFNSAGYLEIAINKGNAAGLFGLQGYSEKLIQQTQVQFMSNQLIYQTVKVYFE
ncbi:MAG: SAM-dependent chlorinase/fluorinase [Ferruginibacter sp.]